MTLEELIENCGNRFSNLWRVSDGLLEVSADKSRWIVVGRSDSGVEVLPKRWVSGNTPREALEKFYETLK